MHPISKINIAATLLTSVLLTACGDGFSAITGAPATGTLSGVAAVGKPILGGNISVICASGSVIIPTTTDQNGYYSISLHDQNLPCAVQVSGGTINGVANTTDYHSIATRAGTVNVTPLTDLLIAILTGSATPSTWFSKLNSTPFTGVWEGGYGGSSIVFYINQKESALTIFGKNENTGIKYDGTVSKDTISVNEYLDGNKYSTLKFKLINSTTINVIKIEGNSFQDYNDTSQGANFILAGDGNARLIDIGQTQINTALGHLSTALPALTSLSAINPITTTFTPVSGNVIDDMLTALASTGITHASLLRNITDSLLSDVSESRQLKIQNIIDSIEAASGKILTQEQRFFCFAGIKALVRINTDLLNQNNLPGIEANNLVFLENVESTLHIIFNEGDMRMLNRALIRIIVLG